MWCMRRQRLPFLDTCASGASPAGLASCLLACAVFLFAASPAPAVGEEVIEGGAVVDSGEDAERGMPASNPRVKAMLGAHPHEFVTICVAGCAGKPAIVQILPKPIESRAGAMRTTAGDRRPNHAGYGAPDSDAVTCAAGCAGRAGQVVQRLPELPPLKVPPHAAGKEGNEPLDIIP